ncbi:DUF171-domain-containing protein [Saccharata proteae CBS 121410]|uniref:DUF171-domain-containing protein n=1 Tax=Saccharata proteae CBS 121410 TaxID=1314787 RepID=A0A9P4M097_9PEZI|nr:DUF171-domain-containing protein [Saccharata proteae CBS 121410]
MKRKRTIDAPSGPDTSRPTAVYRPTAGRSHTLTIALPGSIIANCQRHDIKTALAGQIARACAVFSVDEIVIFNDGQSQKNQDRRDPRFVREDEQTGYTGFSDPDSFLCHLLSYLETPPNLRVALFELHPNLSKAGQLPSLDMPHHLRGDEWCQYREGVVMESPAHTARTNSSTDLKRRKGQHAASSDTSTTLVEAGLPYPISITTPTPIAPHTRVTLKFSSKEDPGEYHDLQAAAVNPSLPRQEEGYYWGYQTRQAGSLSAVFTECPFDGGYDVSVGTSERGVPLSSISPVDRDDDAPQARLPAKFEHMLLVFGGVAGLEAAANADPELRDKGIKGSNVGDIFDCWVNLVPEQGSRTIRCEEAVWCGLMGLRNYVASNGRS